MMLWHCLALLGSLFSFTAAQEYYPGQICLISSAEVLSSVAFEGDPEDSDSYYATYCGNPLRLISLYASAQSWCSPSEFEAGAQAFVDACEKDGVPAMPPSAFSANLTRERIRSYNLTNTATFTKKTPPLKAPIRIARGTYDNMIHTLTDFQTELFYYWIYNYACMGFWAIVLLIGAVFNLGRQVAARMASRTVSDVERSGQSRKTQTGLPRPLDSAWQLFRTHLVIPSALLKHHRKPWWGLQIPTVLETFIIVVYYIINLVLCSVNITAYDGNA